MKGRRRIIVAELLPPRWRPAEKPRRRAAEFPGALVAAALGILIGVGAATMSGGSTTARASLPGAYAARLDLRDAPLTSAGAQGGRRSQLIAEILTAGEAERLAPAIPVAGMPALAKPKLIIIFDDMGPDQRALDAVMALPGPVTLSFLPYAKNIQSQADAAAARGDDILLHLPMEPAGGADPGPGALTASMSTDRLFEALSDNLGRFDGYVGVNNHMGSKFTRDEQAMKRVLAMLDQRGLFFIDSLTTGGSAAARAGAAVGAEVFVRDVFLDAEPGRDAVRRQLALAEQIAARTGYAIVICHPRADTLAAIGPWLTTALARGYELATVSSLRGMRPEMMAASAAR